MLEDRKIPKHKSVNQIMDEKKSISTSSQKYLLWIILIAVFVRILMMIMLRTWEFDGKEKYGHRAGEIGSAIASGQGFSWSEDSNYVPENAIRKTSWEAPVYPLIFAATFKIFGIYSKSSALVLFFFQILLSALCCFLIFLIGKRVFNEWAGLIGATIFAIYPAGIHYGIQKIQTTYLIVVLLLLFILQIHELLKTPTIKQSILTGVTFGISILTDPTLIAFFPLALVCLLIKGCGELKVRVINVVFVLLAMYVTNLPWQIRNYAVFGEFFFIKSNFTRELFMGNYRDRTARLEERKLMTTLDEGKRSKLYLNKAINAILSNPKRLINKTKKRFVWYWTAAARKHKYGNTATNITEKVTALSYYFVLIFFVIGIYLSVRKRKKIQLLLLAIILLPIPYYLTWFTRFRYRFPVEVIMIIIASFTVYSLWEFLYKKTR